MRQRARLGRVEALVRAMRDKELVGEMARTDDERGARIAALVHKVESARATPEERERAEKIMELLRRADERRTAAQAIERG